MYKSLVAHPVYADNITKVNTERFEKIIGIQGGEYKNKFYDALKILKKNPVFYGKVVNNIKQITYQQDVLHLTGVIPMMVYPQTGSLVINVAWFRTAEPLDIASALVHESDHIEYFKSNGIRRTALFMHCNPVFNADISVTSSIPDINHRINIVEICAEKAEVDFHKLNGTKSQY